MVVVGDDDGGCGCRESRGWVVIVVLVRITENGFNIVTGGRIDVGKILLKRGNDRNKTHSGSRTSTRRIRLSDTDGVDPQRRYDDFCVGEWW